MEQRDKILEEYYAQMGIAKPVYDFCMKVEEELKDLKCGFGGVPIHSTLSFTPDELKYEDIQQTIKAINEAEK